MKNKGKLFLGLAAFLVAATSTAWAGEWTEKSVHDAGDGQGIIYKRPKQKSFTSPFDYGPKTAPAYVAPSPSAPQGHCNCFTFDATKSYAISKQKLSVNWDFGDGQTSQEPVVRHCYEKSGSYNVGLVVKDSSGLPCDNGVASTTVEANFPPTAAFDSVSACLGQSVSFDASKSVVSGTPKYTWDFGDGTTGEGVQTTHNYEKPGNYRVTLTIDDGKNSQCSVAVARGNAEISNVTSVNLTGVESSCVGRTLSFNANGVGSGLKYRWDFGDGSTWEGGSSASHSYDKAGTYTVTVTADNGQGTPCSVATSALRVNVVAPPIADAGDNLVCCVGRDNVFDASNSQGASSYHWDFGDGATSDEMKANHVYEKAGVYRVVLTVKNGAEGQCNMAMDSYTATVHAQPQAVIEVK